MDTTLVNNINNISTNLVIIISCVATIVTTLFGYKYGKKKERIEALKYEHDFYQRHYESERPRMLSDGETINSMPGNSNGRGIKSRSDYYTGMDG
jgi:hypothetical protein